MKLWEKITRYPKLGLVLLAYVAFIALGMPDGLMGVAWPSVRGSFSIPLDAIGTLLVFSVAGYLTSSFISGPLVARWGVGTVLAVSCAMTGAGLIGYTLVPAWWMMVSLGLICGLGAGAIDAGLNTYAASNFGEGLMQWLHASYGVGITLGPIIMTIGLTNLNSWRPGYRVVGGFQLILALCFVVTLPMWNRAGPAIEENRPRQLTDYHTPMQATIRRPQVWLSAALFFFYVGAESALGTWTYSLLVEARGIDTTLAGLFAGSYWGMFAVGRILAGLYAKKLGVDRLVQWSVFGALLGALLLIWNPSTVANLAAVALIGFAIAPVFPALMSGTSARVGDRFAANTIGIQMASTGLGTAVIPSLLGIIARRLSLEVVPLSMGIIFLTLFGLYRLAMYARKDVQKEIV